MTPSEFRELGIVETSGWLVQFKSRSFWIDKETWAAIPEGERCSFLTEYARAKTESGLQAPICGFVATTTVRVEVK